MSDDPLDDPLYNLLFPYAVAQMREMMSGRDRHLVHYTSASVAASILREREVWLRNAAVMNDYAEIAHGQRCLARALGGDLGVRYRKALDAAGVGTAARVDDTINRLHDDIVTKTYLISLSEHDPYDEEFGKLSMWRAYGRSSGVALVFHHDYLRAPEYQGIGAFTSPVAYFSDRIFEVHFRSLVEGLERHAKILTEAGSERVAESAFRALMYALNSTKHPGFREEREWRVIYNPALSPDASLKQHLSMGGDTPQFVYKLSFGDYRYLRRIIVGPCKYPETVAQTLTEIMAHNGHADPASIISISNIPLRS